MGRTVTVEAMQRAELMDQYILKHRQACVQQSRNWVQVTQQDLSKGQTLTHLHRGTTVAYEALPSPGLASIVLTRTLQEPTTTEEREKAGSCLLRHRGSQHALNPSIAETQWPSGESIEIITSRNEKIKQLTKYDSTVFLYRVVQMMGIKQDGTHDRCMELQGKLGIVENQITSLRQSLDGLRDDAREQAEQDATVLSETQLRNDV
jgi:hypothetical protein